MTRKLHTLDELRAQLSYDPDTGLFHWLGRPAYWMKPGAQAGALVNGYVSITQEGTCYQAHRIAWLFMTGTWPEAEVDHQNNQRDDNRWSNLRAATSAENKRNRPVRKDSQTQVKGVTPHACGRFRAKIRHNGKHYHLGLFATVQEASDAYQAAAIRFQGEFAHLTPPASGA